MIFGDTHFRRSFTHRLKTQGSDTTRAAVESIESGEPTKVASSLSSSLSSSTSSLQSIITDWNLSHGQKIDTAIGQAKQAGQEVMGTISTSVGRLPQAEGRPEDPEQLKAVAGSPGLSSMGTKPKSSSESTAGGRSEDPEGLQALLGSRTGSASATSKPTIGQGLDTIEAEIEAATSQAIDTIPQSVQDTVSKALTSQGQSQLIESAKSTIASATDFNIPTETLDELTERFRVLIVDGFGSRPELKRGWEDWVGILSDAYGRMRNLQGEMTDVGKEWTIEARGDAERAAQGGWIGRSNDHGGKIYVAFQTHSRQGTRREFCGRQVD